MKHFKQLVKELPAKKVVFTFGRFQPPTIGHGLLVTAVKHIAQKQGADHIIYASRSQDKKSNPLPVDRKVYYLKRMFPGSNFVGANEHVRTFMEAAKELNKKYKNLVMVAGSDRVSEYKKLLEKYNGKDFQFDTIEVISAGERDPDAEGASGMSGTKMRDAAKKGDFDLFKKGLPTTLTTIDSKRLMNEIREGMGIDVIKEEITFTTDKLRESYHRGEIFHVGELVKDENGTYEIVDRGTNYLTVVNESGEISKKWIHMVKTFKQIYEDIPIGPAPKEIKYKGYTTKNLHHSADAAKAFQNSIERMDKGLTTENDPVALLNALKHTDEYMKLNDLHLEKGQPLDDKELASWKHAHAKAKESLERIGEFMHHMDYWHMHGHELEGLEAKYYPGTQGDEFADSYVPEGSLLEMKFTSADKIKVARVIANALGVVDVEKSASPELLVNNALRKIRSKPMRPEYVDVLHKMLATAQEAGIAYDEKLVPQKVSEGAKSPAPGWMLRQDPALAKKIKDTKKSYQDLKKFAGKELPKKEEVEEGVKQPNGTDKVGGIVNEISKETLKSYIPKAMGSKSAADFTRGVKMAQGSGGEEELRKKSEKRSTGIHTAIKKLTKEELEEGKMGQLSADIGSHIDKHVDDYKTHGGAEHLMSKIDHTAKKIATQHGLEHKHALKHVSDYVEKKLHEELMSEWVVKHDGVPADHPDYAIKKQFHGKKDVINHLTKYKDSAENRAEYLKKKGFQNVRIEEGKDYSVTVNHYKDGEKTDHEYIIKNANDHKHAKNIAMQRHEKKIGRLKQGEQFGTSSMAVKELNKEEHNQISDLLEQIATAAMMGKNTQELKKKLTQLRYDPKENESDIEAEMQDKPAETKVGQSVTAPHESDAVRKMKVRQMSEDWIKKTINGVTHFYDKVTGELVKKEEVELEEDQATAEYKVKTYYDNNLGKTVTRKIRPHRVTFKGSKKDGEPEVDQPGEDLKNEAFPGTIIPGADISTKNKVVKEGIDGVPAGDMGGMPVGAPDAYEPTVGGKKTLDTKLEEDDDDDIEDSELDRMADTITDLDDIIDAYDDDELHIIDDDGEHVDELKEETLNEVLSRMERIKAKVRFAQTKAKRERKVKIALRSPSSMTRLNQRARKLAVKLMKQRIARKPLSSLSTAEKERVESIVQKRKKVIDRLAMKLVSRVKKIEQKRLHHSK